MTTITRGGFVRSVPGLTEEAAALLEADAAGYEETVTRFEKNARALRDDDLTPAGQMRRIAQLARGVVQEIRERGERSEIRRLREQKVKLEAGLLDRERRLRLPTGASAEVAFLREREVRDRILERKMDPTLVELLYWQAVAQNDLTTIRAVELAPPCFRLAGPDVLDRLARKHGEALFPEEAAELGHVDALISHAERNRAAAIRAVERIANEVAPASVGPVGVVEEGTEGDQVSRKN